MRSAGVIRTELLKLRDLKHLPYAHICEHSRCSRHELTAALRLEATEGTLRKLDAYLDATHLHVRKKSTELLYRIEQMDRELYRVFAAKTKHILTVQDMSLDQQKRLADAMDYRLKCLLREKLAHDQIKVRLPDGLNYWQCKELLQKRGISLDIAHGNAARVLRQGAVGKSRFL